MKKVKIVLLCLLAIPAAYVIGLMAFYLPSTRKVQITGTEVKRMDVEPDQQGDPTTHDVYFIDTRDPISGEVYVYRNEDTRWGWPPYFKFDSGDLRGKANAIKEKNPNSTVLVTYYGWRFTIFDMYPNAVDLEIVDPTYTHVPWFNIFFLSFLLGGGGIGLWWTRRRFRRFKDARGGKVFARKKKPSLDEPAGSSGADATERTPEPAEVPGEPDDGPEAGGE